VAGVAAVGGQAGNAVGGVGQAVGVAAFAPGEKLRGMGHAFDDFASFVGDGGSRP
jgi:hypothetical protein